MVRIRIGAFVFVGAFRRADRVVRPYGCIPFCIGAHGFAILYRTGGVDPRPYGSIGSAFKPHKKWGELPFPPLTTQNSSLI